MSPGYFLVALAYLLLALLVWGYEASRIRHTGADAITIFLVVAVLQICVAGIGIYGALPLVDPGEPTGNPFFDRVFQVSDLSSSFLVFGLIVWFLVFFYIGCGVGSLVLRGIPWASGESGSHEVVLRLGRLGLVLVAGAVVTVVSFVTLGNTLLERYANLVMFRSQVDTIDRTALNANALSLTQAWSWLSVVAVVFAFAERKSRWLRFTFVVLAAGFALLGVSRRALFLPLLLAYLMVVLRTNRWRLGWVLVACVPLLLWLAFGKELLSALAFNIPFERVAGGYASLSSGSLRAASEVGISLVESVGTVQMVHTDYRFGADHLLALAQRFPEGMLGIDIDWPERIVRTTTGIFLDPSAQDIPPGLAGQMWLDAGIAGPVFWGLALGLQVALVQAWLTRTVRSAATTSLAVVLVFVIALPINSGSYDFTFSIDIIVLFAVLWWCFHVRRRSAPAPANPGPLVHG